MKIHKMYSIVFIFVLTLGMFNNSSAYFPVNEDVKGIVLTDQYPRNQIQVGNAATFTIMIKNLTNNTITNVTIEQQIPEDTVLLKTPDRDYDEPYSDEDIVLSNLINPEPQISVNYINVTESNFTMNLNNNLEREDVIGFSFQLNFTTVGSFTIQVPIITYYDHWGDAYNATVVGRTLMNVNDLEETDTRLSYIPQFDTTDTNYRLIIGIMLFTAIIAILSRVLYLKKPI